MSVVKINGRTYHNVEVNDGKENFPRTLTFILPKANLDLDEVAADFSCEDNVLTVDEIEYTGYTMFRSLAYDLVQIVIVLSQPTEQEQLDQTNKQIEELQDAVTELVEMIGG